MTTVNVILGTPHIEVDAVTSQVSIVLAGPQGPQGESGSGGDETPIHDLDPAPGAPNATDIIEGERDPGGTPSSEKLTWTQIAAGTAFSSAYQAAGAAAGGVLAGTYPNPTFAADMATQAELDAVSTVANAAIAPGDTAGGVLAGTYPNPSFAADMATQAELDAVADVSAVVYFHSAGAYALTGGRIFIGTEDPSADGFTPANGDIWYDPT